MPKFKKSVWVCILETQVYTILHYTIFQPDWSLLLHTQGVTSTVNMFVILQLSVNLQLPAEYETQFTIFPWVKYYYRNKCTMLCSKLLHLQVHLLSKAVSCYTCTLEKHPWKSSLSKHWASTFKVLPNLSYCPHQYTYTTAPQRK